MNLATTAAQWPTPLATDGNKPSAGNRKSADLTHASRMWMTPTARDHKDGATTLANTPVNGLLGRQVLTTQMAGSDTSAPDAEPAVRRGTDGLANRVDRLRLCGNGVVPLVAANALRTLAHQLLEAG